MLRTRARTERGETLLELLIAISIISVSVIGLIAGIDGATRATGMNRRQAEMETWLRSTAEKIKDPNVRYVSCAGPTSYPLPAAVGYDLSADVRFPSATATSFDSGSAPSCPPDPDNGIQVIKLTITVHLDPTHRQSLEFVKRSPT